MQCVEEESSGNIYSQVHCNIKENDWSFLDSTWSQTKQDAYEILPIGGRGIVRRIEGRIEQMGTELDIKTVSIHEQMRRKQKEVNGKREKQARSYGQGIGAVILTSIVDDGWNEVGKTGILTRENITL